MERRMKQIYILIIISTAGFLLWLDMASDPGLINLTSESAYVFNQGWRYEKNGKQVELRHFPNIPEDIDQDEIVIFNTIPTEKTEDMILAFISIHQKISINIDGNLVYQLDESRDPLKKTPGIMWNTIPLNENDLGKVIEIHFQPVYKRLLGYMKDFQIGNHLSIIKNEFAAHIPSLLVCLLIITIGVSHMLRALTLRVHHEMYERIFYLGLFATWFGILSAAENDLVQIFFSRSIVLAYLPYMGMMLLPFPFLVFFRKTFLSDRNRLLWSAAILIFVVYFLVFILQIAKIVSFYDVIFLDHIIYLYSVVVICIEVFHPIHHTKKVSNRRMWVYYSCLFVFIIAVFIDILRFRINYGMDTSFYSVLQP